MESTALVLASITPETGIAIRSGTQDLMVTPRDIVSWVAPGAPINEAKKFLLVCRTAGLNPLTGDAYFVNYGGKWQTLVSKNGYLKVARRDPDYDGHESGIVVQKFRMEKTRAVGVGESYDIAGTILPDDCLLVGGWCRFYRKGISRPIYKRVSMQEYGKTTAGPWQSLTCTMIEKVAIAHATREGTDLLAGTYDDAEIPAVPTTATVVARTREPIDPPGVIEADVTATCPAAAGITDDQANEIMNLAKKLDMSGDEYEGMLSRRGAGDLSGLSYADACDIVRTLNHLASRLDFDPLGDRDRADDAPPPKAAAVEAEIIEVTAEPA